MQALRSARTLARLVLAWFALAIGVAVAAPIVKPQSLELVCSGGGPMKLLVKDASGGVGDTASLDCPLCLPLDVPVAHEAPRMAAAAPADCTLSARHAAPVAAERPGPPPARAPPVPAS